MIILKNRAEFLAWGIFLTGMIASVALSRFLLDPKDYYSTSWVFDLWFAIHIGITSVCITILWVGIKENRLIIILGNAALGVAVYFLIVIATFYFNFLPFLE